MAIERRKDTKNRVLKDGEYQRSMVHMNINGVTKAANDILSMHRHWTNSETKQQMLQGIY